MFGREFQVVGAEQRKARPSGYNVGSLFKIRASLGTAVALLS